MTRASTRSGGIATWARGLAAIAALVSVVAGVPSARAQELTQSQLPEAARGLEPVERVGEMLPLHVVFKNSKGEPVKLGDYFKDGKPAIVAMVYYRCPVVCGVVMDKIADCMDVLDYTVGKDYRTLVFSFDPEETPSAAAAKKSRYLSQYMQMPKDATPEEKAQIEAGWEFHVGTEVADRELGEALGFPYKKLPDGEFSHSVVIFVVGPDGKISRNFYGYDYPPREMKLALLDASQGKIARSIGERILHYCYRYDPSQGKYVLHPFRVVQIAGGLTVTVLGGLIGVLLVGEWRRRRKPLGPGVGAVALPAGPAGGADESGVSGGPTGAVTGAVTRAVTGAVTGAGQDASRGRRRIVVVEEPAAPASGESARRTPAQKVRE
jgi:protein SCO1/2